MEPLPGVPEFTEGKTTAAPSVHAMDVSELAADGTSGVRDRAGCV